MHNVSIAPQCLQPDEHLHPHSRLTHDTDDACGSAVVHRVPQAPQLLLSVLSFTQALPHADSPLGQAQAPLIQTSPLLPHAAVQLVPQLFCGPAGWQKPLQQIPVPLHAAPGETHAERALAETLNAPPPVTASSGLALAPIKNVCAAVPVFWSVKVAGTPGVGDCAVGIAHTVLVHDWSASSTSVQGAQVGGAAVAVICHAAFGGTVAV
jgi:hypothetical protein